MKLKIKLASESFNPYPEWVPERERHIFSYLYGFKKALELVKERIDDRNIFKSYIDKIGEEEVG